MYPLGVPCGYPFPLAALPAPSINIFGVRVSENDKSAFVSVGPTVISQSISHSKDVAIAIQSGDCCVTPTYWAHLWDPDIADSPNYGPQGVL